MKKFFLLPIDDLVACLNHLVSTKRPGRKMAVLLVGLVVTWFVYVPIHELLHVLGCVITGGSVSELEISPWYGGSLLARWFPFVVSGGEYAGRLSGFDTHGSDLIYLATDITPYLLTILLGIPLLRAGARGWRPGLLGVAVVVGLAPFYNLIGDYYEMGSIATTRAVTWLTGGGASVAFEGIRSDDIFKLIGELCTKPGELGLEGPGAIAGGVALTALGFVLGVLFASATYGLGVAFARLVLPRLASNSRMSK